MTSKLKCPFCQQELHKDRDGYYSCYTDNCSVMNAGGNGASGTESLWQALIQAKQDLVIATKALEDIVSDYEVDASNAWCWIQAHDLDLPDATGVYCIAEFNQGRN